MSNPTSNFNWQMPTSSDLVTDLPADFEVFGQAVDTSLADLKGGTTGQILSKASNTDMDFTWTTAAPGDITGVSVTSPITGGGTSGDVTIGISSSAVVPSQTGNSGKYLTTDGTTSSWGAISAGGMTLLSTTSMSGASTTVSSISADYTNLLIVVKNYQYGTGGASVQIGFNGSGDAANYFVNSYGTTSFAGAVAGYPNGYIRPTYDRPHATAQDFSLAMVVNRYSSSDTFKMFNYSSTFYNTVEDGRRATIGGGGFASTSAISSFNVTNNQSYSATSGTIYVYGVK